MSEPSTQEQQAIEAAIAKHGGDLLRAAAAARLPIRKVRAVWDRMEKINRMPDGDPGPGRPRSQQPDDGWPCGTDNAYKEHRRKHEPVDEACRDAHNEANRQYRAGRGLATVTVIHEAPQDDQPEGRPLVEPGYTTAEARVLAGVTYQQLDFWTRTGRIRVVGDLRSSSWQRRRYAEVEVDIARTGKRLLDAGFTADAALRLARLLVEGGEPIRLAHGLVVIDPAGVDS